MKILKAEIEDHEILTSITKKSKAYWGFSEDILKDWGHLLTITEDYIEKCEVYKLIQNEQIIGYYSCFPVDESTVKLDNMFVLPEFIGKGCGKLLMNHFLEKTRQAGVDKITLDAEPNVENFYKSFGFETVGRLQSSIKDRYLPIMELRFEKMNIQVADTIDQKSYDKVVGMLVEYNLSKTKGFENEINKPIEIIARNGKNEIIGGLYGRSIWGTLEIKTFAVNAENRSQGIGRKLLSEAEKEAKNRGCRFISLDTFSFQAPGFYEKLGFEKVGTETDFPKGFEKYYYRKKI